MQHCKRSTLTLAATLLCATMLFASDASAQNLLTNADFETGDISSWVPGGQSPNSTITVIADNGPSFTGSNCVLLDNRVSGLGLSIKQSTVSGTAGQGEYFYSFDLKSIASENGGVFFVEIFAEQDGVGIIGGSGVLGPYTPTDWETFQGSFIAPAGTDFVTMQFSAITGAVTGSVSSMQVDNANISQNPISGETLSFGEFKSSLR